MKIIKQSDDPLERYRTFTLRLRERVAREVDRQAEEAGMSRQALVEAILEQVTADKKFVLRVKQ